MSVEAECRQCQRPSLKTAHTCSKVSGKRCKATDGQHKATEGPRKPTEGQRTEKKNMAEVEQELSRATPNRQKSPEVRTKPPPRTNEAPKQPTSCMRQSRRYVAPFMSQILTPTVFFRVAGLGSGVEFSLYSDDHDPIVIPTTELLPVVCEGAERGVVDGETALEVPKMSKKRRVRFELTPWPLSSYVINSVKIHDIECHPDALCCRSVGRIRQGHLRGYANATMRHCILLISIVIRPIITILVVVLITKPEKQLHFGSDP